MLGTVAMLAFSHANESKFIAPMAGFVFGMAGRGFILNEIFVGGAGKIAENGVGENGRAPLTTLCFTVSVGWSSILSASSADTLRVELTTAL